MSSTTHSYNKFSFISTNIGYNDLYFASIQFTVHTSLVCDNSDNSKFCWFELSTSPKGPEIIA